MRTIALASLVPFAAWFLAACPPPQPPDYGIVETVHEAGVEVTHLCRLACESLAKIGCPESMPAGKPCEEVCSAAEKLGMDMNTVCIANASTADHARACKTVECRGIR